MKCFTRKRSILHEYQRVNKLRNKPAVRHSACKGMGRYLASNRQTSFVPSEKPMDTHRRDLLSGHATTTELQGVIQLVCQMQHLELLLSGTYPTGKNPLSLCGDLVSEQLDHSPCPTSQGCPGHSAQMKASS